MKTLLRLQKLDLEIEKRKAREREIPKQKNKFNIYRERLEAELAEREKVCTDLALEQKECELDIEQRQALIQKYQTQLQAVKKNDEYQALLHEIDLVKKQIGIKEERILNIMDETEEAKARLDEDRKRIQGELDDIDKQCKEIDAELEEAVADRKSLEEQAAPLHSQVDKALFRRYSRIRQGMGSGAALVPMNGEVCGGCHMHLRPQMVNEVLAGEKMHTCPHCGRLLYYPANFSDGASSEEVETESA